jgi:hypothetical protein
LEGGREEVEGTYEEDAEESDAELEQRVSIFAPGGRLRGILTNSVLQMAAAKEKAEKDIQEGRQTKKVGDSGNHTKSVLSDAKDKRKGKGKDKGKGKGKGKARDDESSESDLDKFSSSDVGEVMKGKKAAVKKGKGKQKAKALVSVVVVSFEQTYGQAHHRFCDQFDSGEESEEAPPPPKKGRACGASLSDLLKLQLIIRFRSPAKKAPAKKTTAKQSKLDSWAPPARASSGRAAASRAKKAVVVSESHFLI